MIPNGIVVAFDTRVRFEPDRRPSDADVRLRERDARHPAR